MSKKVKEDWSFSDEIFYSEQTDEVLKQYFNINCSIKKASPDEDIHNNIDCYIDNNPCQYRVQKDTIKGKLEDYSPTIRYTREHSKYENRKKSELFKIIDNQENNEKYPEWLIWLIVNEETKKIKKLRIIDINKFISDFKNDKYELWDYSKYRKLNKSDSGKRLTIKKNIDNSSEFLVLNEKHLTEDTIIFKYDN